MKNQDGGVCCSGADGFLVELVWEAEGKYRVFDNGKWYDVPDRAVVTEPNLAGRAMVWWNMIDAEYGIKTVRCFLPGELG